jgi:hypothetical protein
MDIRLDGKLLQRFDIGGGAIEFKPAPKSYAGAGPDEFGDQAWEDYMFTADDKLITTVQAEAGPQTVGVSFVAERWEADEAPQVEQRGRLLANSEKYFDYASLWYVEIEGPYQMTDRPLDTPSRQKILTCQPRAGAQDETACATEILSTLAHRAYRRPVTDEELQTLLGFFAQGRQDEGSFDAGIQFAIEYLLSNPSFIFRLYEDPAEVQQAAQAAPHAYPLSNLEVASRLSYFLWSSIPDDELLSLAERGQLLRPEVLRQQTLRMLADPKAVQTLSTNFAGQWLNLRRVDGFVADPEIYPEYDTNLMTAFRQETEMFVASTIEEDRNVLDMLDADYTFLNERLARHYGISNVYGNRMRRVELPDLNHRGGILAQGALLSVSSYPDRTSPVLRGKFLLENILASPPAPPPPNVDTSLKESPTTGRRLTIKERLANHRTQPICASCHSVIDPLGFALENFSVLGSWREVDERGNPVDNIGNMPSGAQLNGFTGLREVLRTEQFVVSLTEKLMAYALGRRVEYYDRPTVRKIVRDAAANDYKWSSVVLGIVESPAFLMRNTASTDGGV